MGNGGGTMKYLPSPHKFRTDRQFTGFWKDDKRHGPGFIETQDGMQYVWYSNGEVTNRYYLPDHDREYYEDESGEKTSHLKLHGKCMARTLSNGKVSVYVGGFKDGAKHGQGINISEHGIYCWEWTNGELKSKNGNYHSWEWRKGTPGYNTYKNRSDLKSITRRLASASGPFLLTAALAAALFLLACYLVYVYRRRSKPDAHFERDSITIDLEAGPVHA